MKTETKNALFGGVTLLLAFATLTAGCKKADEATEATQPPAPIEVAPVPVEQDGVFRYADEMVTAGHAVTNDVAKAFKDTDQGTVVASLDKGVPVEKKARRGELVLVTWSATGGQPSFGWVTASALTDAPTAPATAAPTASAAPATSASAVIKDAGVADAAPIVDAAAPKDAEAAEAPKDAGPTDAAATPSSTDAGAGDSGTGVIRLPIQQRMPILKLPTKAEKQ